MKIKNYFDFILEKVDELTVPFQFSRRFESVLNKIDSPIANFLFDIRLKPSKISLVDIGDSMDSATFTTSEKLANHFKPDSQRLINILVTPLVREDSLIYHTNRTDTKIGRLVKRLTEDKFKDSEIENFVNQYKSILDQTALNFEIWNGYDIRDGYSSINYTYTGHTSNQLMNSCMNDCLEWIDFYRGCPVSLLVLLNDEGHIFGRALVWKLDGKFLMDRVYVAFDRDYFKFVQYAKQKGWWWKSENKGGSGVRYTNGQVTDWFPIEIKINFNIDEYKDFGLPYIDTFYYAQGDKLFNYVPRGNYYVLDETDGTYRERDVEDVNFDEMPF
jgi:hypothetical protein